MTLAPAEFMRRFLLHVLQNRYNSISHYGLLANVGRRENLARARHLLNTSPPEAVMNQAAVTPVPNCVCKGFGATMRVVEIIMRRQPIRAPP